MTNVRNNLGRSLCFNLNNDKTLRLLPYENKDVPENEISNEIKSNEKLGHISLDRKEIEKKEVKKEVKKVEVKKETKKKGDK